MTKVKFIGEFYFFEYQSSRGIPQRFHYYLRASSYPFFPSMPPAFSTAPQAAEKAVFSSDYLPERSFSKKFLR